MTIQQLINILERKIERGEVNEGGTVYVHVKVDNETTVSDAVKIEINRGDVEIYA